MLMSSNNYEDVEEVRALVQRYIDGNYVGRGDALVDCFHPDATLCGYSNGELHHGPIDVLFEHVDNFPKPCESEDPFYCQIKSIDVHGDIARATVLFAKFFGNDITDYLSIVRFDGEWKIVLKTFHVQACA